jgi:hypothetical protein
MVRGALLAAAALLASAPALAAEPDNIALWRQAQRIYLPADIQAGARTVTEGGTLFEASLRWANALRLQSDVAIVFEGQSVILSRGWQLPASLFFTKAKPGDLRLAYCTRMGAVNTKSELISDPWLFKTPFNAKSKQLCIEDRNTDGTFETAFIKTDQHILGRPDIIYADAVNVPVAGEVKHDPIDGGTDMLRIVVADIMKNKVSTRIDITFATYTIKFTSMELGGDYMSRWQMFKPGQPSQALFGFDVGLESHDPVGKIARFTLAARGGLVELPVPDYASAIY